MPRQRPPFTSEIVHSRNFCSNPRRTARISSSFKNPWIASTRRSRCTRDSWKSKKPSPTRTSCASRSSRENWRPQREGPPRPRAASTLSAPAREYLLLLSPGMIIVLQ